MREVPYYSHKQRLPKGIAEFVVTSLARRAINDGEDLQEIVDRISRVDKSPHKKEVENLNEILKTFSFPWTTPTKKRREIYRLGKAGFQILKHSAIYQKQILKKEYGGILPRKLPEIIEQVNLVIQKGGQ